MVKPKAHVSDYKKKVVARLKSLLGKYPIVGAVNMENLPAQQLQAMKKKLKGKVELLMTKKRLMKIALEECKDDKKGLDELIPYLRGMPALLFTNDNPFSLFKILKQNKSKAPAKAGQIAPNDIIVPAGPTSFLPGPIIGELGAIGIKSKVDQGKIAIISDSVVVKEGQEIKENVASILTRLNIQPMEVGLDLIATYEAGTIFTKEILNVDEEEYIDNITNGAAWAFNLAVEAGFMTSETSEFMIVKAATQAKNLAIEANILTDETTEIILGKAERTASNLKTDLKI